MNYTITFNPAIDLVIRVPEVNLGDLNRSTTEEYVAGGKGINMSVLLKRLGQASVATGFIGGFSGEFIKNELSNEGIQPDFVEVDGVTRINVKLKSQLETEINANGPTVTSEQFDLLLSKLAANLTAEDTIFLAGNAAPGLDARHYQAIAKLAKDIGAKFVLDTNKVLLTSCLPFQPFLIKPNEQELAEIFEVEINSEADIVHYVQELQDRGARNVIVSRGGDGSLLVTENGEVYRANVPDGELVNSVGAGDSMVAGFMAAFNTTGDYKESLRQGAASGSATAYSVGIGTKELVETLIKEIKVEAVK
ncbi:1-phosphofructokinase [Aerococcaceae bacterium DSM 111176]|nr:1-phosphofructokinase [Aerococcaceae bacterium DSM 111176]